MYSSHKFPTIVIFILLAYCLSALVSGCNSGPGRTEWVASDLTRVVEKLKAEGINASVGKHFMFGLKNDALYLNIRFDSKTRIPPMVPRLQPGMSAAERNAIAAEQDAIEEANRLALKEAAQRDFEVLSQVLRDKDIPLMQFSGPGTRFVSPSALQCKSLGLFITPGEREDLRAMPVLKRVFVGYGFEFDGSVALPQVEDVVITGVTIPALFSLEPLISAFPNMRSLTLPDSIPVIDFNAVKLPASLTAFSLTSGSSPVLRAYNLNGVKNLPGITHINGTPAETFEPCKNLTPEQLAQYNAIPSHIWAEKRFPEFLAQPQTSKGSVPLRGKIMLHAQGSFLSLKAREGVDERLRNAMTENADECDVLVVIATQVHQAHYLKWIGDSTPVMVRSTGMYIFSKNGECEAHTLFYDPTYADIPEDQKERNARYRASGVWGEMELLFKKANPD